MSLIAPLDAELEQKRERLLAFLKNSESAFNLLEPIYNNMPLNLKIKIKMIDVFMHSLNKQCRKANGNSEEELVSADQNTPNRLQVCDKKTGKMLNKTSNEFKVLNVFAICKLFSILILVSTIKYSKYIIPLSVTLLTLLFAFREYTLTSMIIHFCIGLRKYRKMIKLRKKK